MRQNGFGPGPAPRVRNTSGFMTARLQWLWDIVPWRRTYHVTCVRACVCTCVCVMCVCVCVFVWCVFVCVSVRVPLQTCHPQLATLRSAAPAGSSAALGPAPRPKTCLPGSPPASRLQTRTGVAQLRAFGPRLLASLYTGLRRAMAGNSRLPGAGPFGPYPPGTFRACSDCERTFDPVRTGPGRCPACRSGHLWLDVHAHAPCRARCGARFDHSLYDCCPRCGAGPEDRSRSPDRGHSHRSRSPEGGPPARGPIQRTLRTGVAVGQTAGSSPASSGPQPPWLHRVMADSDDSDFSGPSASGPYPDYPPGSIRRCSNCTQAFNADRTGRCPACSEGFLRLEVRRSWMCSSAWCSHIFDHLSYDRCPECGEAAATIPWLRRSEDHSHSPDRAEAQRAAGAQASLVPGDPVEGIANARTFSSPTRSMPDTPRSHGPEGGPPAPGPIQHTLRTAADLAVGQTVRFTLGNPSSGSRLTYTPGPFLGARVGRVLFVAETSPPPGPTSRSFCLSVPTHDDDSSLLADAT